MPNLRSKDKSCIINKVSFDYGNHEAIYIENELVFIKDKNNTLCSLSNSIKIIIKSLVDNLTELENNFLCEENIQHKTSSLNCSQKEYQLYYQQLMNAKRQLYELESHTNNDLNIKLINKPLRDAIKAFDYLDQITEKNSEIISIAYKTEVHWVKFFLLSCLSSGILLGSIFTSSIYIPSVNNFFQNIQAPSIAAGFLTGSAIAAGIMYNYSETIEYKIYNLYLDIIEIDNKIQTINHLLGQNESDNLSTYNIEMTPNFNLI